MTTSRRLVGGMLDTVLLSKWGAVYWDEVVRRQDNPDGTPEGKAELAAMVAVGIAIDRLTTIMLEEEERLNIETMIQ